MAEAREFKPVKDIGSISISETSSLKFYVDEYRGHKYASIRTFVKSGNYNGPTRLGITLNLDVLKNLIEALSAPMEQIKAKTSEDGTIARFPRRTGVELVARIVTYNNATGIDLREWVDDQEYKGWSRRGARIPDKEIEKAVGYLKEMQQALAPK